MVGRYVAAMVTDTRNGKRRGKKKEAEDCVSRLCEIWATQGSERGMQASTSTVRCAEQTTHSQQQPAHNNVLMDTTEVQEGP